MLLGLLYIRNIISLEMPWATAKRVCDQDELSTEKTKVRDDGIEWAPGSSST